MREGRTSIGTIFALAWREVFASQSVIPSVTDYIYPARVDWVGVLEDLARAGCSGYRVAALMGMDWSTVQGWKNGSEPRHSYGEALLALHTRYCGVEATKKRQSEAKVSI